jgi:hypothetical protein
MTAWSTAIQKKINSFVNTGISLKVSHYESGNEQQFIEILSKLLIYSPKKADAEVDITDQLS